MGEVGKIIGGAALIAGAIALDVASGGAAGAAGAEEFTAFLAIVGSTGASLVASGAAGLLAAGPVGSGVSSQNPIKAWDIAYGKVKAPGTIVYTESNGGILSNGSNTYDKCFQAVYMLAGHPIAGIDEVRLNGKTIPLGAGGSGALSTEWTYTPPSNQNQTNIVSISRTGGVVTMKLAGSLPGQTGKMLSVQRVHDNAFNGQWTVTQPNPADDTTYTYLCGGADFTSSGGYVLTCEPDYKNRIHVDRTSCLGNHTSTFPELLSNSTLWTAAHKNLGKASCYMAFYYDQTVFANGIPQSNFIIRGKNDIYDPRLGDVTNSAAHGYTTNAALIIADYLTNKVFGYGLDYGTDVPLAQLIAAANVCDETVALAAGGHEARYTINMLFSLNRGRGEVLQDMLNCCAGRLTIESGQYIIVPGAWVGPTLSLSLANLVGPIEFKPYLTIRDAANGVKGTYTSPVNNWQSGDIPPYAEDALHGYASDRWLDADNGVRYWKDVSFPGVTSCPTSQRLAKIDLERLRREGRLTLHCDMSAYTAVALDVIEFTHPRYSWNSKTFEVLSSSLVVNVGSNGEAPSLGIDLELAETDSTVYDWSTLEELTPNDSKSPALVNGQIVLGPQFLELESGPSTAYVGADGVVVPRILAAWLAAPDAGVLQGGHIRVEYQRVGDTLWTPAGNIGGDQMQFYIPNVVNGWDYNVQVQGFTAKGEGSGWAQAGPVTASATATSFSASSMTYPDGTPVSALQPAQAGADATRDQTISYTGIGNNLIDNGNFLLNNIDGWAPAVGATGGYGNGNPNIVFDAGQASQSPTFFVVPGRKYRCSFTANPSLAGAAGVYHRIFYAATYSPNTQTSGSTPYHDFLANGTLASGSNVYTYDWTCPSGIYFASLAVYNQTSAALLVYSAVAAEDYGGLLEWPLGAGTGTVATIVDQGDLATLNKAGTINIVANAVNSSVVYTSGTQFKATAFAVTTIAQATLTTNGGYVKVFFMMQACTLGATTSRPLPHLYLRKGGVAGTILVDYGNLFISDYGNSPLQGISCISMAAVDATAALAQQYTVTMEYPATDVYFDGVTLIVENAKV